MTDVSPAEKSLDSIIQEMVDHVSISKDEVFTISEKSRKEHESLEEELVDLKARISSFIEEEEKLEEKVKGSRKRLARMSKQFNDYSEAEMREMYEETHRLQTELTVTGEKEKQLRERRDDIERRLRDLGETIEKAENLAGKISVVLNYLNEDFREVSEVLQDARQKQEFGLRIIEAQEEERRRLSREIHDGPAQMLANVLLRSDLVERTFRERSPEEAILEMRSVKKMVRSSLYEVRRIIYDLRPMALDDLGILPALRKYLSTAADYHGLDIRFQPFGKERRLDPQYEVAMFRLIQEALQNAVKHAGASRVDVKVELTWRTIMIIVEDDGSGFDVEEKKQTSFGLMGMSERIDMLDGELNITSVPDAGTKVTIKLPIKKDI
ncbi:sensor histidine kinase [Salimicrobium salexigens]|uniref:Signal transduction histidine-protein kinase/phosphatase DegS n=1 Tax=Salimicrobium salexigens TaxID=908941 RepID=A0ABY1KRV7_9BACI|nr:sensor histidine kinase [Salimicrobium salexigens]SIS70123.1 two-component system, NarL family, sensor histidine kinase DegS [Salimicrobium salexigens]